VSASVLYDVHLMCYRESADRSECRGAWHVIRTDDEDICSEWWWQLTVSYSNWINWWCDVTDIAVVDRVPYNST